MSTFYSIHDYYISHHGIKGQKWGVRRWRNEDGTLTEEGRKRYERLLAKYTTTTRKGNVHLKTDMLNKRSATRGTVLATTAAFLGNRASKLRTANANEARANLDFVQAVRSPLNGRREIPVKEGQLLEKASSDRFAAEKSQKKARAIATGVTAVTAASAAKEAHELKFLMDNADAYGGKSMVSLKKELSAQKDRRNAKFGANTLGMALSYYIFNK